MLHLRRCILSSPSASPISPLHRLLSAAAPPVSANPSFAAEEYLVETCGLSRAQALKAARKLSHLKSPTNPDAVLAFLAGLGLSGADVAALVAKDPKFLCAGVERTLAPILVGLSGIGLWRSEIARLVCTAPISFRCRSVISNLPSSFMVLQECGLSACDIAKLFIDVPWILAIKPERLRVAVACAEGIGVPRGSVMFRHALHAVAFLGVEEIAARVEYLKNTFRWSDAEVNIAVSKLPTVLARSKDTLQSRSEFLISEVGLEPAYIARRPALLSYSLEGRLRPRYCAVKFLKENRLLDQDRDYYKVVSLTEKVFREKYISPHDEAAPHLADDYAAACRGEMPTRFRFT
ncbi:unnamed protein product [Alopecurus aequalis]